MSKHVNFSYKDIEIKCNSDILTIENSTIKRVFDLAAGIPRTLEVYDKTASRKVFGENPAGDFSFIGMNLPEDDRETAYFIESIKIAEYEAGIFDGERIELDITIRDAIQQLTFRRRYIICPELPVMAVKTSISALTSPDMYWHRRSDYNCHLPESRLESRMDSVSLSEDLVPLRTVEFAGRTDYTDEQVIEHEIVDDHLTGNLFFCRSGDGCGAFILQEAPPSAERRDWEKYDFRLEAARVYSCGWGIEPQDVGEPELWGYRHVVGCFREDGSGGASLLKKYLKTRFPLDIERHTSVMVNPWGCGCFPQLVGAEFLEGEIKAAGELHATHYQIDDGWQYGKSLGQLSRHNQCADADFWKINPELFPKGFESLLALAEKQGLKLALWVAPSANRHYRDWKEFADMLYDYHRKYGFEMFKIDFVKIRTKEAEDNLEKMLRYLREKSNGKIYFNLDTTNGQRSGYFMFLEYGNIFLENRYACRGGVVKYHPEKTLNNLWNLAKYLRPQTLQIEFTDPGLIDRAHYRERGVPCPDQYDCGYWAAVTLFANPLVWLAAVKEKYRAVIDLHRKYSREIFRGEIYPIGTEPNGKSITGFQSHDPDTGTGLFILYCEIAAPLRAEVPLLFIRADAEYECYELSVDIELSVRKLFSSKFDVKFSDTGTWKLFRYSKA